MLDLECDFTSHPCALAELGEAMGRADIPLEGGGVFTQGDRITAHFLFRDGLEAKRVGLSMGIRVVAMQRPLIRRLKQGTPGQLGAITRALADAGVSILTQYSDPNNQLILICDRPEPAAQATAALATDEGRGA